MTDTGRIRVLVVDDHAVVRSGLTAFLLAYDDLELAGETGSGEEAVRMCAEGCADVVLMDLVMPSMDGAEATRLIREACPDVQVIALTSFPEEDLVQGALKAGAIGYLLKNTTADELAAAIRAAHAGKADARAGGGAGTHPHEHRRAQAWGRPHRARARSARAHGGGPLQPGDRRKGCS